jgi:transposase
MAKQKLSDLSPVAELWRQGKSKSEIVRELKISRPTLYKYLARLEKEGRLPPKGRDRHEPAPTYEDIESWFLKVLKQANEANMWKNKYMMQVDENQVLKKQLEELKSDIEKLRKLSHSRQEYENMRRQGEIPPFPSEK